MSEIVSLVDPRLPLETRVDILEFISQIERVCGIPFAPEEVLVLDLRPPIAPSPLDKPIVPQG